MAEELTPGKTVNGVNVEELLKTLDAIKAAAVIAKFKFRLQNEWQAGATTRQPLRISTVLAGTLCARLALPGPGHSRVKSCSQQPRAPLGHVPVRGLDDALHALRVGPPWRGVKGNVGRVKVARVLAPSQLPLRRDLPA